MIWPQDSSVEHEERVLSLQPAKCGVTDLPACLPSRPLQKLLFIPSLHLPTNAPA